MANVLIKTIPEKREDKKVSEKIKLMVEDRNKAIAKRFNMNPLDVEVHLHTSRHKLLSEIRFQGDPLGIYCGFLEGTNIIHLVHPNTVDAIFGENLDKEFLIFIDYTLIKFYMNQKYYPDMKDYKMYYRYLTESLARISSGNFREEIIKFDMKTFNENKKYNKEKELMMAFYVILKKSGIDFIYEILDDLVKSEDIKKFIFEKYNKSLSEIIQIYQKEILEEERKAQIKFRNERKGQRENIPSNINSNFNNRNYNSNRFRKESSNSSNFSNNQNNNLNHNSYNNSSSNIKKTFIRKTNYKPKNIDNKN